MTWLDIVDLMQLFRSDGLMLLYARPAFHFQLILMKDQNLYLAGELSTIRNEVRLSEVPLRLGLSWRQRWFKRWFISMYVYAAAMVYSSLNEILSLDP